MTTATPTAPAPAHDAPAGGIEQVLKSEFAWTPGREITTVRGPRVLHKASTDPRAMSAWIRHKDALKAKGVTLGEWPKGSGNWSFSWFKEIPPAVIEARKASVAESWAEAADVDYPRPAGIDYMPFQKAGIRFCLSRDGTLLADEMGLGKTIQVIGTVNADPTVKKVLVVCPSSLALNWRAELRKWLARPLRIELAGTRQIPGNFDILIATYPNVHKIADALRSHQWDLIALDEAHQLKGRKTLRTKAVLGYKPKRGEPEQDRVEPLAARRRIAITGTPILNATVELYGLVNWVCPERFGNVWSFLKSYTTNYGGRGDLEALQLALRESCMIRRLKADVLKELPAKVRSIKLLENEAAVEREQKALKRINSHAANVDELRAKKELAKASGDIEVYQQVLRELDAVGRVPFEEIARVRHETALEKAPMVVDEVKAALEETEKVLVFAHHQDVLDLLQEGLAEFNPMRIDGSMGKEERDAAVTRFQTDPSCRVGVLSMMAASVGLTLTKATLVVFAELDWVPANMSQAEDRAHRIGQRDTVMVVHVILAGSLDQRMAELLVEKQTTADRALNNKLTPEQEAEIRAGLAKPVSPMGQAATGKARHVSPATEWLDKMAEKLTPGVAMLIHRALGMLAGVCDGAARRDDAGFSKVDVLIGKSLALAPGLSRRQAALGYKLCRKYQRQLGTLWSEINATVANVEDKEDVE